MLSCSSCAHVIVCESDENRILAESMLNTIMKYLLEYVTSHEQGNAEVNVPLLAHTHKPNTCTLSVYTQI